MQCVDNRACQVRQIDHWAEPVLCLLGAKESIECHYDGKNHGKELKVKVVCIVDLPCIGVKGKEKDQGKWNRWRQRVLDEGSSILVWSSRKGVSLPAANSPVFAICTRFCCIVSYVVF